MGRLVWPAPIAAGVAVAHIVHKDEHNIGPLVGMSRPLLLKKKSPPCKVQGQKSSYHIGLHFFSIVLRAKLNQNPKCDGNLFFPLKKRNLQHLHKTNKTFLHIIEKQINFSYNIFYHIVKMDHIMLK
jgi:hypothetical protein